MATLVPLPQTFPHEWKPILVMICPNGLGFWRRYRAVLQRMQRDARIMYVGDAITLDIIIEDYGDDIAGFVVTDSEIMEDEHEALATRLPRLLETPEKEWAVVFAFDFPSQALLHPLQFSLFMEKTFGLEWKVAGETKSNVQLEFRESVVRKMGPRIYRSVYGARGVFLKGVKQSDKVVIATRLIESDSPDDDWIKQYLPPDTAQAEGDETESESESDDDDDEEYTSDFDADVEDNHEDDTEIKYPEDKKEYYQTNTTDSGSNRVRPSIEQSFGSDKTESYHSGASTQSVSDWCPSDEEGTEEDKDVANCPVAIHEFKTWLDDDTLIGGGQLVKGYLGFVGHVEDNKSMCSLILGMCSVGPTWG